MNRVNVTGFVDGADLKTADIPVASQLTRYSQAVKIAYGQYFSLSYKAAVTAGAPDVGITIEESIDGKPPVTEGASSANFVKPESFADIVTDLTDQVWHIKSLSPVPSQWIRLVFVGKGTNAASTTIEAYISIQEQIN